MNTALVTPLIQPSETRVEIGHLWAWTNPHLAHRGVDSVFEEYGNAGTYRTEDTYDAGDKCCGFIRIVATRLPDGERRCMTDVLYDKQCVLAQLDTAMEMWIAQYRAEQPEWMMEQIDAERHENLKLMEDTV